MNYILGICIAILLYSCITQKSQSAQVRVVTFYYSPSREFQMRKKALQAGRPYIVCLVNEAPYTSLNDSCGCTDAILVAKIPIQHAHVRYVAIDPLELWETPVVYRHL